MLIGDGILGILLKLFKIGLIILLLTKVLLLYQTHQELIVTLLVLKEPQKVDLVYI